MLIDTHAHVNFAAFKDDSDEVIKRSLDHDIWVVNVGTQIDTSREAVKDANKYESGVYAVIGIHPVHTYQQVLDEEETRFKTRAEKFVREEYFKLGQDPKVVGIGECGLDYYRLPKDIDPQPIKLQQKEAFVAQIKLAKELNKALVIHCRPSTGTQDAYEDILAILDSEIMNLKSEIRFEIHSFTGSPEVVQEFLKRGAYVGLNGIITFGDRKNKNSSTSAEVRLGWTKVGDKTGNMEQVVKSVPLDRIVLETDSPYLTPIPNRGKRNEPSFVKFVAEKVAQIKNLPVDEVSEATTRNAKGLFNI
jgi:TatD DNase family protein